METALKTRTTSKEKRDAHAGLDKPAAQRAFDPADAWCRGCHSKKMSQAGQKNGFHLLRCDDCGTVSTNPTPTSAELTAYYSQYYMSDAYVGKKAAKLRRSLGRIRRIKRMKPPGKKFLDVGCSVGFVVQAAQLLGLEAHGIDIDATAIKIAKGHSPSDCHFETISIQDLAKRDGETFDMTFLGDVLEHVPSPDDFIAHVSAVMKPGAIAFITVPDGGHFRTPKNIADWNMVYPPEHLTYFTRKGISLLLARHGLEVVKFQLAFKPGMKVYARKLRP
jgi:2-polyprenyl-3-methyl-5-hydroxy-6-metoxy-1,4-benzoquinol methylase